MEETPMSKVSRIFSTIEQRKAQEQTDGLGKLYDEWGYALIEATQYMRREAKNITDKILIDNEFTRSEAEEHSNVCELAANVYMANYALLIYCQEKGVWPTGEDKEE